MKNLLLIRMNYRSKMKRCLSSCIIFFIFEFLVFGSYPLRECMKPDTLCIESVIVRHYPPNSFISISEFFTGRENTGGDTILRTDELNRSGLYLVVGLNQAVNALPEDTEVVFQYILSNCRDVKKKVFEIKSKAGSSPWLFLGVTGQEYIGLCQTFLAWSLKIHANGECVTQKSYLWEMEEIVCKSDDDL